MALGSPPSFLLPIYLLSPLRTGISFLGGVVSPGHRLSMLSEHGAALDVAVPVDCVGAAAWVPILHRSLVGLVPSLWLRQWVAGRQPWLQGCSKCS